MRLGIGRRPAPEENGLVERSFERKVAAHRLATLARKHSPIGLLTLPMFPIPIHASRGAMMLRERRKLREKDVVKSSLPLVLKESAKERFVQLDRNKYHLR